MEEWSFDATVVRLGRACPQPQLGGSLLVGYLGPLYAKFVDVAAKAAASDDGVSAWVKRERMALDEVEALINEMAEDQGRCPKCGR